MTDFTQNPTFDISIEDTENILSSYNGPTPPANLLMSGVLHKMFLTRTSDGTPMLKVIYMAVGGDYDGYVAWDNITIKSSAAFKWNALCEEVLLIPVADFIKHRVKLDPEMKETAAGIEVATIGKLTLDGTLPVTFAISNKKYVDENGMESKMPKLRMVWNNAEK